MDRYLGGTGNVKSNGEEEGRREWTREGIRIEPDKIRGNIRGSMYICL